MDLLSDLHRTEYRGSWSPQSPPSLDGITEIELDTETTGLRWWKADRPIGIAIRIPNGKCQYLPFGHSGGNLDEATVKRWAERELRGKKITNLNTKFDIHMLRAWGVDLEAQGNTVSDVGHYAALLDDHRQKFSLDSIAQDYLGIGKTGQDLDKTCMAEYHAGQVASYACNDVHLVGELKKKMLPLLAEQNLMRVKDLEDEVIYVTCEMERNGAPINVELLDKWLKDCEQAYYNCLWQIWRETGIKFEPTTACWAKLFKHQGIPITEFTSPSLTYPLGQPSFTDEVLKPIDNRLVQLGRKSQRLKSLNAKYLVKYKNNIDNNGILRYALHQLRASKDEWASEGEVGTVSGRFSSSEIIEGEGLNIQQELKAAKQRISFGYDEEDSSHDDEIFLVRKLRIPENGQWLSADAMQIEYRMFANIANNPRILKAYEENPELSFHRFMHGVIKKFQPTFSYRQQKDLNFAVIYAAGLLKQTLMLNFITKQQFGQLKKEYPNGVPNTHPLLAKTVEIKRIYDREIPEVAPLLKRFSHLALPECNEHCHESDDLHREYEHRGWIQTIIGRRSRFPNGWRTHKALNAWDQGSSADILKQKLVELHRERKFTGFKLRYTVHDEVDGDAETPETKNRVKEILNSQSFPFLKIPILWDVSTGPTWGECK
jgi:DNA polymerase I-like protein with 3'-5' exonuclease and polymerase domains